MPFYTKPISQLGTADIQELLSDTAVENLRLEFKLKVPEKEDTLKKLSAFANTFGGFMVIGAEAEKDGRIKGLPGVDAVPGYKQRIVDWCYSAVSPPFHVEVSDPILAPASSDKVCYVAYVPESETAPHFLNGRKGVYVRTDEFLKRFDAQLATEFELRQLFDRRRLVRERRANLAARAKVRFETHAASKNTDANGKRTITGPILELFITPRFPARQLCLQEQLAGHVRNVMLPWRGVVFVNRYGISQHESMVFLDPTVSDTSIFEVNVWGSLFYGVYVDATGSLPGQQQTGISSEEFVGFIILFLRHATTMFQRLGYSGPVLLETTLKSIRNIGWFVGWHRRGVHGFNGSPLDDEFRFELVKTTEELQKQFDGTVIELLRQIFLSVNLVEAAGKLQDLIMVGYDFNQWERPETLSL